MDPTLVALNTLVIVLLLGLLILLGAILVQVIFILKDLSQFLSNAKYELYPVLKELPEITANLRSITGHADTGAEALEKGVGAISKGMEQGVECLKDSPNKVSHLVAATLSGIKKSFTEK
ncbi:MAG: hypothetical protein K2X66_17100 [Cyanobacteria bacterium]|nr:hypothetical protein [Cyanobacteriota bacterium]